VDVHQSICHAGDCSYTFARCRRRHDAAITAVLCVPLQSQRAQPDGVDGSSMELKTTTTTTLAPSDVDLTTDVNDMSWMSSLPEISTLDYSPQATAAGLTIGPHSGKQTLAAMNAENNGSAQPPADVNENDVAPLVGWPGHEDNQ